MIPFLLRSVTAFAVGFLSMGSLRGAEVLFAQQFDSGERVEDYAGSGPNKFDHIGSTGDEGNFAAEIRSDDLVLRTRLEPEGGRGAQGFIRSAPYLNGQEAVRVEFNAAFNNDTGSFTAFGVLEFGNEVPADYTSHARINTHRFLRLEFRRGKRGMQLRNLSPEGDVVFELPPGSMSGGFLRYQLILNASGRGMTYAAPGELGRKTLDSKHMALFFDAGSGWEIAFDNAAAANGSESDLTSFRFVRQRIDPPVPPAAEGMEASPALVAWDSFSISSLDETP